MTNFEHYGVIRIASNGWLEALISIKQPGRSFELHRIHEKNKADGFLEIKKLLEQAAKRAETAQGSKQKGGGKE